MIGSGAEVVVGGDGAARVVLTCEHASHDLPVGWSWPLADHRLKTAHWAWDPGAADFTRELAEHLGAAAVLARYSRLVADLNREVGSPTMFRDVADGLPIALNEHVDVAARIDKFWQPYHDQVDAVVDAHPGDLVLSIHSFSPVYEGSTRWMEVGVLFDDEDEAAEAVAASLRAAGYAVALNEPWSGRGGLMYAVSRAAERAGRRALELELRQDLVVLPEWRAALVLQVAQALQAAGFSLR